MVSALTVFSTKNSPLTAANPATSILALPWTRVISSAPKLTITSSPLGRVMVWLTAVPKRLTASSNLPSRVNWFTPTKLVLPLAVSAYFPADVKIKPSSPSLISIPTASVVPYSTKAETPSAPRVSLLSPFCFSRLKINSSPDRDAKSLTPNSYPVRVTAVPEAFPWAVKLFTARVRSGIPLNSIAGLELPRVSIA